VAAKGVLSKSMTLEQLKELFVEVENWGACKRPFTHYPQVRALSFIYHFEAMNKITSSEKAARELAAFN
jgi:hypothetical protein